MVECLLMMVEAVFASQPKFNRSLRFRQDFVIAFQNDTVLPDAQKLLQAEAWVEQYGECYSREEKHEVRIDCRRFLIDKIGPLPFITSSASTSEFIHRSLSVSHGKRSVIRKSRGRVLPGHDDS